MAFSSLKYDKCAETESMKMAGNIYSYIAKPPVSDIPCIPNTPLVIMQQAGDSYSSGTRIPFSGPIDVDSDLRGVGRYASDCVAAKYSPKCGVCGVMNTLIATEGGYCEQCNSALGMARNISFGTCDFAVDATRLSNPATNAKGVTVPRWNPLCSNPQDHVFFPGQYLLDTRSIIKDSYRPCIPVPRVNSMNPM